MTKKLFGTNGIRGLANVELTPDFTAKVGQALGTFYGPSTTVYLGRDGRTSGPLIKYALLSGLTSTGCKVIDVGLAPTPTVQYAVKKEKAGGAIIITASHNPPEYNGIKVVAGDGIEIPPEDEDVIEETYYNQKWKLVPWNQIQEVSTHPGILDFYKEDVKKQVDTEVIAKAALKVVVDPGNGVGALVTPYLLKELGCKVITINSNIDGTFPGRVSEPTPTSLQDLMLTVKAVGADLGVAHDGDADRTIFIDDKGEFQWGDRSFGLIEKDFLTKNPGEKVVTPISSSQLIKEVAEKHGGKLILTKVGSTVVSRKMVDIGAKLGGEENGGVFYGPHQPVRDGAMTAALIIDIIAKEKKPLSELLGKLHRYYSLKDKVECPNPVKTRVLNEFKASTREGRVEDIDGVKVWPDEGSWVLVRPSGTEPIFRIFAESSTEKRTRELIDTHKKRLTSIIRKAR